MSHSAASDVGLQFANYLFRVSRLKRGKKENKNIFITFVIQKKKCKVQTAVIGDSNGYASHEQKKTKKKQKKSPYLLQLLRQA